MCKEFEVLAPAPILDVLTLAAGSSRRRVLVLQHRKSHSVSIRLAGAPIAVAWLFPETPDRVELCTRFSRAARPHMRRLIRICQLMLRPLADHGVVILARVGPEDRTRRRMHRLAGFVPTGKDETELRWIGDGRCGEDDLRRQ
ncbi:hypothetical protein [Aurantimonas coralicida]|uniref:hypothetical protein n=1 Tax=Aurantimonas coralicida TaxID=182270 RepID=UPI0012DD5ACE|nr:hypothetical protein [Aurantimonas coralicida]